jgi:hypothetical protein
MIRPGSEPAGDGSHPGAGNAGLSGREPQGRLWMVMLLLFPVLLGLSCSRPAPSPDEEQHPSGCTLTPLPEPGGSTVTVKNAAELLAAVGQANAGGDLAILLEDGTYQLDDMLWISGRNVAFRGRSRNRDAVVLRGRGMSGGVTHIFNVSGSGFTAADLTVGWVANHAVQIHSSSDNPVIHNVRFVDTGEQMLKVSYVSGDSAGSDNGLVEWCLFEYSAGVGPQYYIGGIDAHQARDWTIRRNVFKHIRSPEADLAEPAIHFWSEASGTLVEGNTITGCDRGIGFGMGDRGHSGGMIRNNMVHTTRDVGISLESASGAEVCNNSVFAENYENAIEYRFSRTRGVAIINNLTNGSIAARDGGSGRVEANVAEAQVSWFVAVAGGNLRLKAANPSVVDQGQTLAEVSQEVVCESRPKGAACDVGADEW